VREEQRTPSPDRGWSTAPGARTPETAAIAPREDGHLRRVVRLETRADARESGDPRTMSVSARHEAVLDDGSRVLLLDDRGWSGTLRGALADETDAWAFETEDEILRTARTVVGPDEPFGNRSQEDMEDGHWATLAGTLRAHGVTADAGELRRLPHDVVLGEELRARLAPSR
jgi:hypothetical protein